jgi:hypothetical protein
MDSLSVSCFYDASLAQTTMASKQLLFCQNDKPKTGCYSLFFTLGQRFHTMSKRNIENKHGCCHFSWASPSINDTFRSGFARLVRVNPPFHQAGKSCRICDMQK